MQPSCQIARPPLAPDRGVLTSVNREPEAARAAALRKRRESAGEKQTVRTSAGRNDIGGIEVSIFGSIMSKIFGTHAASAAPASAGAASGGAMASAASPAGAAGATGAPQSVDVEAVLSDLASKNPQQLNWRTSIIDLMKLLDLDSSLDARRELARELHFTGDTGDTAAMNMWLQRQVMQKLAENGGKVPDELKS
jgi:hypothetical protein